MGVEALYYTRRGDLKAAVCNGSEDRKEVSVTLSLWQIKYSWRVSNGMCSPRILLNRNEK